MLAATALVLLMTPGARPLLRRPRAVQEHAQHLHDVRRGDRGRDGHLGARSATRSRSATPTGSSAASTTPSCNDVDFEPRDGTTIPHLLFMAFQATFCIITVALVSGAVVERMRFGAFLVFAALWSVLVYAVLAHWAFGGGWLHRRRDARLRRRRRRSRWAPGFSALAAALVVGARKDYGRQALLPHNAVYVLLGAGLLWFGWFGFNGGSGFSTGEAGVLAFTNTLLTPACTLRRLVRCSTLIRGRQVTAIGAATAIIVGCVRHHPRGRLRQPAAGRWRSASLGALPVLRGHRVAAAHAGGRDARRAGRPRHRGPHRDPVHRLLRQESWNGVVGRAALRQRRAARRPGAGRRSPRRPTRSSMTFVLLRVLGARDAAARHRARGGARAWTSSQHGEEAYATGEGAILVVPEGDAEPPVPVAGPPDQRRYRRPERAHSSAVAPE